MRKETSNTWSDGVIMDLNPLNTPNTVLTDNLNGTLITYNGNEHSLQNDMGNYKLENCRLTPNYVPVGLKQYADILYIVSYNPLDETTEIGSYPSPLQVNAGNPNESNKSIEYAIIKTIESGLTEFTTEEVEQNQFHFIFAEEHLKLNPGDLYRITLNKSNNAPKYEDLEYYIVDEDKKLHDVTDLVEKNLLIPDYCNVPWTVPGWLSVKSKLVQFDRFTMDILNFQVYDGSGLGRFRFQFAISDSHLIDLYKTNKYQFLNDLRIDFEIHKKENDSLTLLKEWDLNTYNQNYVIKEWYDNNIIIQFDFDVSNLSLTDKDFIKFKATPYLNDSTLNYKLIYEKLTQEIETWINDIVVLNATNTVVGNELYRFRISNDGNKEEIEFDLSNPNLGDSEASYLDPSLKLWYMVYDLSRVKVFDKFKEVSTSGLGIYTMSIDFDENFSKENIYIIQFVLSKNTPTPDGDTYWSKDQSNSIGSKLLITSRVFNDFYEESYAKFDEEIEFEAWVNKYLSTLAEDAKIEFGSNPTITRIKEVTNRNSTNTDYWDDSKPFNTFVMVGQPFEEESVLLGHEVKVDVKVENGLETNVQSNRVGMWASLLPEDSSISLTVNDELGRLKTISVNGTDAKLSNGHLIYNTHALLKGTCTPIESESLKFQPFTIQTFQEKWGTGTYKDKGKIIQDLYVSFKKHAKDSHKVVFTAGGPEMWESTDSWDGVDDIKILKEQGFTDSNRGLDEAPATWFKFDSKDVPFYFLHFTVHHTGTGGDYYRLVAEVEKKVTEDSITFCEFKGDAGSFTEDFVVFRMDNGGGENENVIFLPANEHHTNYLDYLVVDSLGEPGIYSQWRFDEIDWNLVNNVGAKVSISMNPLDTWMYYKFDLRSINDRNAIKNSFPGVTTTLLGGDSNLSLEAINVPVSDFDYMYSYENNEFPFVSSTTSKGKVEWDSVYRSKLRDVTSQMQEWNNSIVSREIVARGGNVEGVYHPEGTMSYTSSDFLRQTTTFYKKYHFPGFAYSPSDPQTYFDTSLFKLFVGVIDSGTHYDDYVAYYLNNIS